MSFQRLVRWEDGNIAMSTTSGQAAAGAAIGLRFLTDEDWQLLLERAEQARFSRGDVILVEGSRGVGICVIRSGFVRIERAHLGHGVAVARRGPGEIVGEQSFLQGSATTASVVADEDVEVSIVGTEDIDAALTSDAALATRLYHSLALLLSDRLSELTATLPPLLVEGAPLVGAFRVERTGRPGEAQLPQSLFNAIEEFKTAMLEVDRGLTSSKVAPAPAQALVSAACTRLEEALRDHIVRSGNLEGAIGTYVFRETFPFFMLSRFVDRAFTKPRGYAGDYATIQMLYDDQVAGDSRLGPLIDRWTYELPAARAVKNRRALLAEAIRGIAAEFSHIGPVPVTSLAAGPARELFDVMGAPGAPDLLATCIDIDYDALAYASGIARELGLADHFNFAQDNVVRLSQGRGHTALGPQALIYSIGLTDYLQDKFVVDLINWAYDHLLPGGMVIIGNVVPSNPTRAFMDHVLEWVLIHRSEDDLRSLFSRSHFGATTVDFRLEPAGVDLFAFCRRSAD
jgi:extracellular factor (EF) 3-hydroxypalmitic acid methyl ester biosynthesis protein